MSDRVKRESPVLDRILKQIRADVRSARVKPGERLPTQTELVAQFNTSKATIQPV